MWYIMGYMETARPSTNLREHILGQDLSFAQTSFLLHLVERSGLSLEEAKKLLGEFEANTASQDWEFF